MRIWVTRTAPENGATARRLQALGHDVVSVPVLDVRAVDSEPLRAMPDAIVFTSGNGVRHHPLRPEMLDIPVFTVGDRTAEAASEAGYRNIRSADGNIADLQRLILSELPPCRLVHFGGRDTAGDLKGFLGLFGYRVDRRIVYAAHAVAIRWLLEVRTALPTIDGIVVHSPRAGERVARLLSGTGWTGKIWCISEACALRLSGVPGVQIRFAARPDEAALIELVRRNEVIRMPARVSMRVAAEGGRRPIRLNRRPPANDNGGPSSGGGGSGGDDRPPAA